MECSVVFNPIDHEQTLLNACILNLEGTVTSFNSPSVKKTFCSFHKYSSYVAPEQQVVVPELVEGSFYGLHNLFFKQAWLP